MQIKLDYDSNHIWLTILYIFAFIFHEYICIGILIVLSF